MGEIADALRRAVKSGPASREPDSSEPVPPGNDRDFDRPHMVPPVALRPSPSQSTPDAPATSTTEKELSSAVDEIEWTAARSSLGYPRSDSTQQYRRIAFRVRELADARGARSIVLTSAESRDGKTTTACNLSVQLARLDHDSKIVLVDLDLHRAGIAAAFGISVETSVDEVLAGKASLDEAVYGTNVPGLSILALNSTVEDPEWLLANSNLKAMIRDLEERFDFVIIDTPPILATSDAQVVMRHAASGLLIVRAGITPVASLRRAIEHIPTRKFLGSLLNSSPAALSYGDYPYYGGDSESSVPKESPEKPERPIDE